MVSKQYYYFEVLVREGSFSAAAEALGIKQPSLSQYIKKLEQNLGVELIDREGSFIFLTDAGREYLAVGRRILGLEKELETTLSELGNYSWGSLRMGLSAHRSMSFMPEITRRFKELYPGLTLYIDERKRSEILEAAAHGEFDLCLTTLPVNERLFHVVPVFVEDDIIAIPSDIQIHSENIDGRLFPSISVHSLNGLNFVMLNEEHPMQQKLNELCTEFSIFLHCAVVCTSLQTQLEHVKAGLGAALLPSSLCKKTDGVSFYTLQEVECRRELVIIYQADKRLTEPTKELICLFKNLEIS